MSLLSYFAAVESATHRCCSARTTGAVLEALGAQVELPEHSGRAFYGGDGDDLHGALLEAGWTTHRYAAAYYWVVRSPDGSEFLSYTEGDVDPGDNPACGSS